MKVLAIGQIFFVFIYGQNFYSDKDVLDAEHFDFIVVGSGPSGAVLANRLTEVPEWKVLLIESGDEASFITDVPFLVQYLQFSKYNWGYKAEKDDRYCLGCPDGIMSWPHGKALGGSTVINYMIAARGNRHDYDRWAQMGNRGWSYEEVLPYFKKSEDNNIVGNDPDYHGRNGCLSISQVDYRTEAAEAFVRAAQEAGYPYVDYNGKNQLGVSFVQSTTKGGFRVSAEKAFLRPIRHRKNLNILLNARVIEVLINKKTKTAYGVKYVKNKKTYIVNATKEVLLSAGVFNSPQILMLSGIGPKDHLNELGIPVIQDLPVGEKLYDHIIFTGMTFTVNESIVHNLEKDIGTTLDFLFTGMGPLASIGGVEALAFFKSNISSDPAPTPDIEYIFIGGSIQGDGGTGIRKILSISKKVYDAVWGPLELDKSFQIYPMLTYPKSVGYMKLKSKNPFHWPKFYPRYLSDPDNYDVKILIASIREAQRIVKSPSLQKYGASILTTPIPGCETHTFDSDDYWECAIRHVSCTLYHQLGTCKMGPPNDPEAVVDPELKVFGIKNLRVVDVSILPTVIAGHTSLATYMIGEKAADMIKEEWGERTNML